MNLVSGDGEVGKMLGAILKNPSKYSGSCLLPPAA